MRFSSVRSNITIFHSHRKPTETLKSEAEEQCPEDRPPNAFIWPSKKKIEDKPIRSGDKRYSDPTIADILFNFQEI
jgi:hypothetical protein